MTQVNMLEAKTKLSKLVEAVETGAEKEIVLARNGKPVARIVPLEEPKVDTSKRLGIAEGQFGEWTREMADESDREMEAMWKEWLKEPIFPEEPTRSPAKRRKRAR
jgi:prevent-host-death family protein